MIASEVGRSRSHSSSGTIVAFRAAAGLVTTSNSCSKDEITIKTARFHAGRIGLKYIDRSGLKKELSLYETADVLIFSEHSLKLARYEAGVLQAEMSFHPSSSLLRLRNLEAGGRDILQDALEITTGDTVLDCTMGLCSDSIVASAIVGPFGAVTSIEGSLLAFECIDQGIGLYCEDAAVKAAAQRIKRMNNGYEEFLALSEEGSYDIVYMDPMFTCPPNVATPIDALRTWAIRGMPDISSVNNAVRVARRRFVMKARKGEDISFLCSFKGYKEFFSSKAGHVRYVGIEKERE